MSLLSKEDFTSLALFNNDVCISIFIPTQRGGKEVLEGKNQRHLKSQWKEIKNKLEKDGVSKEKIENMSTPVNKLIENGDFWRHQSDGLAVFVAENVFEYYTLPVNFEAHHYIGKEFYLKPLVPMFSGKGKFFILEIQPDHVAFFEATNHSITPIEVDDLTPDRLEDRVGYDYEEKHRKHKTQNNSIGANPSGTSTQHGYAPATRDRKDEFLRFFRAVDQGLDKIIHNETAPLIVACEDYLFPIYQEANTYNNLYGECVPGNPNDNQHILELHAKALDQIRPHFEKEREEKLDAFKEEVPEKKLTSITDILPSIYEGKVDTLFLENREDIFGTFNEESMKVKVEDEQSENNTSLMNLAAKKVIEQGGSVYLIESAFMPEKESKMSALLRYS